MIPVLRLGRDDRDLSLVVVDEASIHGVEVAAVTQQMLHVAEVTIDDIEPG